MLEKIAKNSALLSLSQVIARAVGFFYYIFLARFLSVSDFGAYAFTLAFIYNFIPVADFGLERLVLRDISREQDKFGYYFSRLFPLRVILAIGAYLGALILGLIFGLSLNELAYLAIFGIALLPYNLLSLIVGFQNAKEKMEYMALANILLVILSALIGTALVALKLGLTWLLFSYPLANLITLLVFAIKLKVWGSKYNWNIDREFIFKALSQSWIFAALTIIAVFYLRTSVVLTGLLKGSEATGIYGSVFKFLEGIILIPQSISLAMFPVSSRLLTENKKRLLSVYLKGVTWLFLISLPILLTIWLFSRQIISFSYGEKYLSAALPFSILGLAITLFFVNGLSGNIIQNSNQVKVFLPFYLLNLVAVMVFCLILIPAYGVVGAAWSVVLGELLAFFINNLFVFRILRQKESAAQI